MSKARTCIVCKSTYKYCPRCYEFSKLPKWYTNFCGDECKDIYTILNKYAFGHIDKDTAKSELGDLNYKKIDNRELNNLIDKIFVVSKTKKVVAKDEIVNVD